MVNGQKVWTSGAHDADVLLTFVRTDPNAAKHKGISALMIPTDLPGVVRRPFASVCDQDDVDFNEVFFNDVRVPAENLVGPLNGGWRVANGSLGHERNMLWLSYADRLEELVEDFRPSGCAGPRPVRHAGDGQPGAAPARLGGAGARRARRGGRGGAVGAEAVRLGGFAAGIRIRAGARQAPTAWPIRPSPAPYSRVPPRLLHGPAGSNATCGRSAAPSQAARPKSNATSSPSACWACPETEESAVYIDYDVADRIATITLNRPEAANAQNPELLDELDAAWTARRRGPRRLGDRVAGQRKTLLRRP